ncbi:anti-sigma factor family protein [Nocardioides panaciterrulae]|uniref:Putative zinc-finger domain-containing protein n=1 Tax=Nocardioides panaciterrulae TaxID=661492 RepID=A0A7Y9E4P9_9ACTN|nr:zf-HC2 domain-containing protein [Nocardioides panaciterrulae]NYD41158.1 hypothetical protein [Nocardioides panaciterrulae]
MSCDFGHLDGSYVLGALSPIERREYEEHLDTCPTCAHAVQELAGLPGLLARVDPSVLEEPYDEEQVPETLLPALVGEVRRSRRRRTMTAGVLAAAAAAVVVTLGAVAVDATQGGGGTPGPTPTVSAAAGRPMQPVAYTGMQADVAFTPVPWGTRLDLTCSYAEQAGGQRGSGARTTYSLVVHTRDGRTEQIATWHALPGRTMRLAAATSAAAADIASVEVRTAQGQPVLRLAT